MMYFILSRKKCILFALLALSLGIVAGSITLISTHAYKFFDDNVLTVIIDAGHGLPDGGAVGKNGTVEQEINLKIAKKLQEVLSAKDIRVIMTRTDSSGIWKEENSTIRQKKVEDMYKRLEIMNKSRADLFVSIHMNSYPSEKATGLRIFFSEKFSETKPLAENIQLRMSDITGAKTSVVKPADSGIFLMKNATVPAILVECGFLSNPEEERKLEDDEYQSRLAWAIADAIEKYYCTHQNQPAVDFRH